mmetsp:Transcript_9351/g.25142  ORF Transcript_9351/g.25142 Transcript_9351/m.25142 type:complete len:294 (+) Transcript_9351:270-1151(+)
MNRISALPAAATRRTSAAAPSAAKKTSISASPIGAPPLRLTLKCAQAAATAPATNAEMASDAAPKPAASARVLLIKLTPMASSTAVPTDFQVVLFSSKSVFEFEGASSCFVASSEHGMSPRMTKKAAMHMLSAAIAAATIAPPCSVASRPTHCAHAAKLSEPPTYEAHRHDAIMAPSVPIACPTTFQATSVPTTVPTAPTANVPIARVTSARSKSRTSAPRRTSATAMGRHASNTTALANALPAGMPIEVKAAPSANAMTGAPSSAPFVVCASFWDASEAAASATTSRPLPHA